MDGHDMIIKQKRVRDLVPENQVSKRFLFALEEELKMLILRAKLRCENNGRTRLEDYDL